MWSGAVRIGGHDVRNVRQSDLGAHVAMVLQEPFLFTGSVYDNIRYNRADATRAEVEAAARAVGAHEFVERLPEGYDTVLDQRGANLSLGQRQLLSFARALVADAPILVLDEATANVDSYTERQIQSALARLLAGRTAIVIAHRLATIRGADRILVLRDGELVEQGTHDALVAQGRALRAPEPPQLRVLRRPRGRGGQGWRRGSAPKLKRRGWLAAPPGRRLRARRRHGDRLGRHEERVGPRSRPRSILERRATPFIRTGHIDWIDSTTSRVQVALPRQRRANSPTIRLRSSEAVTRFTSARSANS